MAASIVTQSIGEALALANVAAQTVLVVDDEAAAAGARGRRGIHRTVDRAGGGRLRHRLESPAATAGAARFHGGLNAADFVRSDLGAACHAAPA